jgi:hypothetical protein
MNYLTLCGMLAGSMTDPPALAFANNLHATSGAAALSYATVYPLVMFLRIITRNCWRCSSGIRLKLTYPACISCRPDKTQLAIRHYKHPLFPLSHHPTRPLV